MDKRLGQGSKGERLEQIGNVTFGDSRYTIEGVIDNIATARGEHFHFSLRAKASSSDMYAASIRINPNVSNPFGLKRYFAGVTSRFSSIPQEEVAIGDKVRVVIERKKGQQKHTLINDITGISYEVWVNDLPGNDLPGSG